MLWETVYNCYNNYSCKLMNITKCSEKNVTYGELNSEYIQELLKEEDKPKKEEFINSISDSLTTCVFDGYGDFLMFIVDNSVYNKAYFPLLFLGICYIGFIYEEEDSYWRDCNFFDGLYIANSFLLEELFNYYTPFSFTLVIESSEGCPILLANELLLIFGREISSSIKADSYHFFKVAAFARADSSNYKIIEESDCSFKILEKFSSTSELPTADSFIDIKKLLVDIITKELLLIMQLKKKVTGLYIVETIAKYIRFTPYLDWLHLVGLFIYSEEPLDKLEDNLYLVMWKPDVFFSFLLHFDKFINVDYFYNNNKYEVYLPFLLIRTLSNDIIGERKFYCNKDEVYFCEIVVLQH